MAIPCASLQGRGNDLADRTVVPQMDHLRAAGLEDAPHDVDRGIVPVEQRGGGDQADFLLGLVADDFGRFRQIVHRSNSLDAA